MSISKVNKKNIVFELAAPFYGLFYNHQKKHYIKALNKIKSQTDFFSYKSIIDIGCGTGALCSVLNKNGFEVTGIDLVQRMLNTAMGKKENKSINFIKADILKKLPFRDKNFDVCISSYVAHGLNANQRKVMYKEMNRITRHLIIFHDYNQSRSFFTNIIEWLEGGDYFNFIGSVRSEMKESFSEVKELNIDIRASWYVCKPKDYN